MQYIKIEENIQKNLIKILNQYSLLHSIINSIVKADGIILLVGGAVRDLLLGLSVKDLDCEVHGISLDNLEQLLGKFGIVSLVGKQFGVLRLHGLNIDWSVPRNDSSGRKPTVVLDPSLSIEEAFRRRDLTINAMGINLSTYELIDPFNGLHDLQRHILRTPDPALFVQDPLRFFRVMQFVGRFQMNPDATLNQICSNMDISGVSRERIEHEFKKLLLQSKRPSLGLVWLDTIGRLADVLPELAVTKNISQEPKWHPEGDVFEHSKQSLDAAAALSYDDQQEKLIILYAALCHDLGKATTTEIIDHKVRSFDHAQEGAIITKKLLQRITNNKELIDDVCILVRYHMQPTQLVLQHSTLAAYKRLAQKLAPLTLNMLAKLALADKRGRNQHKGTPLTVDVPEIDQFLIMAQKANVLTCVEQPLLQGKDLLDVIPPGPLLGAMVKKAYQVQIEENIHNKEELKERIVALLKE